MLAYHHIRYAKAARFGEPQIAPYEEPTQEDFGVVAYPQNRHRMGFVMGDGEPLTQSEDCHFLSIYTPSLEGKRPVLVWIHGGAYMTGSGEESAYDGSALAAEGDIVVVTVSYRLGVFGYLYNPQGEPQNLGLKDQLTALRWVHQNISRFGGDPEQATLAGQSAGGYSVASLIAYCKEPLEGELMSVEDVCKLLGKSKSAVYRTVRCHDIPFIRQGSRLYFDRPTIKKWLEKKHNVECITHMEEFEKFMTPDPWRYRNRR